MQSETVLRAPPALYQAYGEWDKVMRKRGYWYVGSTDRPGRLRSPHWRPERVLTVSPSGQPTLWHNECLHAGMPLLPASEKLRYRRWPKREHEPAVQCPWHRMSYGPTGNALGCGAIRLKVHQLREQHCETFPVITWRGLGFELGEETGVASDELLATLQVIEEQAGEVFDFRDYRLRYSLRSPQPACALTTLTNYADCTHLVSHRSTLEPLIDLRHYKYWPQEDPLNPRVPVVVQLFRLRESWKDTGWGKLHQRCGIPLPKYGAVWVTTRMGLMFEFYPGVIVVSQVFTPDPARWWECVLYHDFFYHVGTSRQLIRLHQQIFAETGFEDEEWCKGQTESLRRRIATGLGMKSWGYHDPNRENFGPWIEQEVLRLIEQLKAEPQPVVA